MGSANAKVSARERARAAKAKVDADRAARDKKIEGLVTDYYLASDEHERALAVVAAADVKMSDAVLALGSLDVPVDQVAQLCGIDAREVRIMRKTAKTRTATAPRPEATRDDAPPPADAGSTTDEVEGAA